MTNKAKQDRLADLAMRFWREVDCPSEGTMFALFHLLAEGKEEAVKELLNNNLPKGE